MAYEINRFNGTLLVAVDDQTVNATATDLRFVGRNYAGYGEIQNENFLWLLQNFANTTAPPRAVEGQVWYDSSTKKLKFFDGNKFKAAGGADASAVAPTGLVPGDFWFDTVSEQVNVWNGTEFVLVGPDNAPTSGTTSSLPLTLTDNLGAEQVVVQIQAGGETIAIVSKNNFTINSVINPITGFSEIKKGINFLNSNPTTGVTGTEHRFWGTSANSDRLGGYAVTEFLRSANTFFTTQAGFSDSGLTVGDQRDLKLSILNGNQPIIENTLGRSFIFRISDNGANIKDVVEFKSTGIDPGSDGIYNLGSTGAKWNQVTANTVKATTFYGKFVGEIETPLPAGYPEGAAPPPLAIQSVAVSGSFSMAAPAQGAPAADFSVNLAGSTGAVSLASGAVGTINNFNIGTTTRGSGAFTTLTSNDRVTLTANTTSTSTTTGTLVVTGGVGVSGPMYVGSSMYLTGTGGIQVPVGTTAQRPANPPLGMMRFNTDSEEWEGWDGTSWRTMGGTGGDDFGEVTSLDIEAIIEAGIIPESIGQSFDYGGLF